MCSTLTIITIYYSIVSLAVVNLLQHKLSFNMFDVVEFSVFLYISDNV